MERSCRSNGDAPLSSHSWSQHCHTSQLKSYSSHRAAWKTLLHVASIPTGFPLSAVVFLFLGSLETESKFLHLQRLSKTSNPELILFYAGYIRSTWVGQGPMWIYVPPSSISLCSIMPLSVWWILFFFPTSTYFFFFGFEQWYVWFLRRTTTRKGLYIAHPTSGPSFCRIFSAHSLFHMQKHLNSKLPKSELKLCGFQVSFSICPSLKTRESHLEMCVRARNGEQGSRVLCWEPQWRDSPIHHRPLEMERTRKRPGRNLVRLYYLTSEKIKVRDDDLSKVTCLSRRQEHTYTSWL